MQQLKLPVNQECLIYVIAKLDTMHLLFCLHQEGKSTFGENKKKNYYSKLGCIVDATFSFLFSLAFELTSFSAVDGFNLKPCNPA